MTKPRHVILWLTQQQKLALAKHHFLSDTTARMLFKTLRQQISFT